MNLKESSVKIETKSAPRGKRASSVSARDIVAQAFAGGVSLLEATVACHNTGLNVTECAPQLYKQSPVKPPADELATVLAAVWWGAIFADRPSLGSALRACGAFTEAQIAAASAAAMAQYHDVFVRKSLDDTGAIPYTSSGTAAITHSPDIILAGTTQTHDPAEAYGEAHYGEDLNFDHLTPNELNFIYVRAKNLFPAAEPPDTTSSAPQLMAYATLGTIAAHDSKNWQPLTALNGAASVTVSGAQGAVLVGTVPFQFRPAPQQGTAHYCLIGRVVTNFNPNPLPDTSTIAGNLDWVRNHPGYCWRNVAVSPMAALAEGVTASIHYRNADPEPRQFALVVDALNAPGMRIAVTAAGSDLRLDETTIAADRQQVSTFVTLPGSFDGMLDVRMHSTPDFEAAGDPNVELRYYALLTEDHPGFRHTQEFAHAGIHQQDPSLPPGARPAFLGNYLFRFAR